MFTENTKSSIEMDIGVFILEELENITEFNLLDVFSVIANYLPANYIPSREYYIYSL